ELNAAILKAQHAESTQPKLATVLKLLLWCQGELDKKNISSYPKMTDLVGGKIEEAK
ncbi:Protein C20orf11 (Two hybrid associated protein 1 with RanBPM) (Twa1)like, partial [Caligus rogercresseyi]